MTIGQQLAHLNQTTETRARGAEFVHYARDLMLERGSVFAAVKTAEANRAMPRIVECLKAATTAGTTTDATWASPAAPYGAIVDGFLAGLAQSSAFDSMIGDMRMFPLHTQIAATTVVASGATVPEGSPKPATKLLPISGRRRPRPDARRI